VSPARLREAASSERDEGQSETAILTIDLDALTANYRRLRDLASPAECAAVVKADAYGLGMAEAAPALVRAGCKTFFVATLGEAKALRALLPHVTIYVFAGLMPGTAELYRAHDLRPVLNSAEEIREWASYAASQDEKLPCAVHLDSGMNRLGLSAAEVDQVADARLWQAMTLSLVMSHLACADEAQHSKSEAQRMIFDRLRARLPAALASLANSAGILLGRAYAYDLVRPGIALYGGKPSRQGENPFHPVVHLKGRILQVRNVAPGETIGYGATRTLHETARVAVVSVGYADGFFRSLSTGDGETGLMVYLGARAAPILGRVSMDLITIDVTGVPEEISCRGGWVELIGPNVSAQDMAHHAGTIDYEVLTNLGRRAARRYLGG
jgi:alanine racemase